MNIKFEEKALEELFRLGKTKDKHYNRLPKDIIQRYVKTVNYLRAASRIEDLYLIKSLHYERKKGAMKDKEAVWINDQYRLLFTSSPDEYGVVINTLLIAISKHYE